MMEITMRRREVTVVVVTKPRPDPLLHLNQSRTIELSVRYMLVQV